MFPRGRIWGWIGFEYQGRLMIDVAALRQPRSQHWVASQSGVSRQTLRNLSRIGLLPPAQQLTGADVVVARCAHALGATRSTNRREQAGEWTAAAQERDRKLIKTVRSLLNSGQFDARTTIVVYPDKCEATAALEAVSEWMHTGEAAEHLVLLPVGKWALAVPGAAEEAANEGVLVA
ncbi:hypothetical protein GCM10010226_85110 [Streptomyces phaeofaciens]|uniref:Uncharacterized protein n=1 Tax=Streptomyces phaeofaciens TaxID=68254 RepID=A0A918M1E6_9ACTN|nr:hypothetical protein GCM10010226_85110 [Streptomyces phaeofaciens]